MFKVNSSEGKQTTQFSSKISKNPPKFQGSTLSPHLPKYPATDFWTNLGDHRMLGLPLPAFVRVPTLKLDNQEKICYQRVGISFLGEPMVQPLFIIYCTIFSKKQKMFGPSQAPHHWGCHFPQSSETMSSGSDLMPRLESCSVLVALKNAANGNSWGIETQINIK